MFLLFYCFVFSYSPHKLCVYYTYDEIRESHKRSQNKTKNPPNFSQRLEGKNKKKKGMKKCYAIVTGCPDVFA